MTTKYFSLTAVSVTALVCSAFVAVRTGDSGLVLCATLAVGILWIFSNPKGS
ncbi:MAG: hypothetical protein ACAI34_22625 [Verrucomicrobium sp.]